MNAQDRLTARDDLAGEVLELHELVCCEGELFRDLQQVAGFGEPPAAQVEPQRRQNAVWVVCLTGNEGIEHRSPIHLRWPAPLPSKRAPLRDQQGPPC